jgi:integrase
MPCRSTQG